MKVWIDRDSCESNLSACISCFGELVRKGSIDRGCILDVEDDGTEDITVYMQSEGKEQEPIFIPADMREIVAYDGWDQFVPFKPKFRRNEGADRVTKKE